MQQIARPIKRKVRIANDIEPAGRLSAAGP
jgi:hypothetical protein